MSVFTAYMQLKHNTKALELTECSTQAFFEVVSEANASFHLKTRNPFDANLVSVTAN